LPPIRKILELIALSSLVANKNEYARARKNFNRDWNAKFILNDLEKINPKFYPVLTKQILDPTSKKVMKTETVKSGYLTRSEFENICDRCGGLLHANNPFGQAKDIDKFIQVVPSWMGSSGPQ